MANAAVEEVPMPRPEEDEDEVDTKVALSNEVMRSFSALDVDADLERITVIESLCVNCGENGQTRMLLTSIPYFRDIIVLSFRCDLCGFSSTETQSATDMADKACRYQLHIEADSEAAVEDLNRQVIRSEKAVVRIPEKEFEIPATTARGEISTVEGIIRNAADALDATYLQSENDLPEEQIDVISDLVDWFRDAYQGNETFTFVVEDLTGNSYVQNPNAPRTDPRCTITHFDRTQEQVEALGYAVPDWAPDEYKIQGGDAKLVKADASVFTRLNTYFDVESKAAVIPGQCHNCGRQCETRMCITDIPKFKEIIIMVTECNHCGFKDSEVKPSGAISDMGSRTTLEVTTVEDLKREVLKSDSAGVRIPEIDLELMPGTLGGKYTTLEGLMSDIETQLKSIHSFHLGDSAPTSSKSRMQEFMLEFKECQTVSRPFTLVLEDPLGNCYIGTVDARHLYGGSSVDLEDDPCLTVEQFERTEEMNEDFGIADMKVENYASAEDIKASEEFVHQVVPDVMDGTPANADDDDSDDSDDDEEDDEEDSDDDLPDLLVAEEPAPVE